MDDFSAVLAGLSSDGARSTVTPDDGWRQGRTLFGGIAAGLALEAALRAFPALPPLRSAQFAFVGPSAGTVEMTATMLRAGRSASFVEVKAMAESGPALQATLCFGAPRSSTLAYTHLPPPDVLPAEECGDFFKEKFRPGFADQFEGRFAGGARPVSSAATPEILMWIRHRDAAAPDTASSLVVLGDVPPPAAFPMFTTPAPISTMTWSFEVLADTFQGATWHLARSTADTVSDGYSSQSMTIWDAHGRPVLAGRQSVAIYA